MKNPGLNQPIVGIGASAGGLKALERFFAAVPVDSGCCFVVVQHLSAEHPSMMQEYLARRTKLSVQRIEDGMAARANAVYVLPPGKLVTLHGRQFVLSDRKASTAGAMPINLFFNSLAAEIGPAAVGVVLSGGGMDGALGARSIRQSGGLVLVQSPETAEFESMPRNALSAADPNGVLAPENIPSAIIARCGSEASTLPSPLDRILLRLKQAFGTDFAEYKPTTITRRVQRRCYLGKLHDLVAYDQRLENDPEELKALYSELLIGVTSFFRDPQAFAQLGGKIAAEFSRGKEEGGFRIWVAACATGEEAYSFAILLDEISRETGGRDFSIFATDLHPEALATASAGMYTADRLRNLSPERLRRYFSEEKPGFFRVLPELRKRLVFASHNLLGDPPFPNLDLVSCRNVLIYFRSSIQERATRTFHRALKEGGCLFLGLSERVGEFSGAPFEMLDPQLRLFRKVTNSTAPAPQPNSDSNGSKPGFRRHAPAGISRQLLGAYDHILRQHVPPGLVIDEHYNILHYFGTAARYLLPLEGRAENGLLERTAGDLRLALSVLLPRVLHTGKAASSRHVKFSSPGGEEWIDLSADPISDIAGAGPLIHVCFAAGGPNAEAAPATSNEKPGSEALSDADRRIAALEAELQATRENLQMTVEELQAGSEEISASNEELQSANEELTAVNDELLRLNAEFEAKNAELQSLNDDLNNLSNSTEAGTVFVDRDLRIRKFNPAVQRIFPIRPQDIGRPIDHIGYHLDGQQEMLKTVARVLERGQMEQEEVRTRDGRWLLKRVLPFRTAAGSVAGVVLTFTDIDETKAMQNRLDLAMESSRMAWWDWDLLSGALRVNCGTSCMLGYTGANLPSSYGAWEASVHPDDRARVAAALAPCRSGDRSDWSCEHRFKAADGSWRWVRNSGKIAESDAQKRPLRMLGTTQDIHDRHTAEERTHRDAELLSRITEAIICMDSQGVITYWNQGATALFGWTESEMIGRHHTERFPAEPQEIRESAAVRARAVLARGDLKRELEDYRKDGSRVWTDGRLVRFNDTNGKPAGVIALFHDITERRQAERQRKELEQQLLQAQKMDTIGTLAGGIAHDFNNIIAAILGYTELAMTLETADGRLRTWHEGVLRAARRARDLVQRILTFSRFHEPERKPIQLSDVIQDAIKFARASLPATIQWSLEMGERYPVTLADANQIHQVVLNLATNAAHAMREHGGTLTIRLRNVTVETDRSTATGPIGPGRYVVLEFSDTGHGIPAEILDKIFDPFFTTKPVGEGTGLGLSIIHGIVTGHSGGIDVASQPGKGATFTVYLPVVDYLQHDPDALMVNPALPDRGDGQRIAVIDDEADVGRIVQCSLQALGYDAVHFDSAEKFYREYAAARSPVALVLTDQTMPRMTGLELARQLRSAGSRVPIIITSGFSRDLTPEALTGIENIEVLRKPFGQQELAELVHRLVAAPPVSAR